MAPTSIRFMFICLLQVDDRPRTHGVRFAPGTEQVPQHDQNKTRGRLALAGERRACRKLMRTAITRDRSLKVEYAGQKARTKRQGHAIAGHLIEVGASPSLPDI